MPVIRFHAPTRRASDHRVRRRLLARTAAWCRDRPRRTQVFTRTVLSGLWHWSTETAFHVSNTKLAAVDAADAIRDHWKIETTSHYSRDITFGEDKSPIRAPPGSLLASVASPSTSSSQTRPAQPAGTATALLWQASITCSRIWRSHSVEQPWRDGHLQFIARSENGMAEGVVDTPDPCNTVIIPQRDLLWGAVFGESMI